MAAATGWSRGRRAGAAWLTAAIGSLLVLANTRASSLLPAETLCWSVRLLGRDCPGCGLTRSMLAIWRGDFAAALEFNWLGIAISFALMAFLLIRILPQPGSRTRFDMLTGALLLIAMVARTVTFYSH